LRSHVENALKFKYLGKITRDPKVEEYVLEGKCLLDLPSDSPAYISVKEVMRSAGYVND
jgi:hypothetical protein